MVEQIIDEVAGQLQMLWMAAHDFTQPLNRHIRLNFQHSFSFPRSSADGHTERPGPPDSHVYPYR